MKKCLISACLLLALCTGKLYSQSAGDSLSAKIADKMKDSLSLSVSQRDSIHSINQQLNNLKYAARQQYTGTDSVRFHLQRIENTRDSLYQPVLGEEKYLLYREKKRALVNNN